LEKATAPRSTPAIMAEVALACSALRTSIAASAKKLPSSKKEVLAGHVSAEHSCRRGEGSHPPPVSLAPWLLAHIAACVRLFTPILRKMFATWTLTVASAAPTSRAMTLFG
jgi:hypothetical protein